MDKDQEKIIQEDALAMTGRISKLAIVMRYSGVESVWDVSAALVRQDGPLEALCALLDDAEGLERGYAGCGREEPYTEAREHIERAIRAIKRGMGTEE